MKTNTPYVDADALQARLALRLVAVLNEEPVAHDIGERLRVAREQAVARARESRRPVTAAAPAVVGASRGGAAVLGAHHSGWYQMASVLPLFVLVAGLVLIGQLSSREQVLAAADIDSVLLADDLPPAAYTDPGFAQYLDMPAP